MPFTLLYCCTVLHQCTPVQSFKHWQLRQHLVIARALQLSATGWQQLLIVWHSPSGGQGVKFIKEDDAAWQHLCSLEHLCQQALALTIPLGSHSLQGDIHQRHRGLTCYHSAQIIPPLSTPLVIQECCLRKLTGATTHLHGSASAGTQ